MPGLRTSEGLSESVTKDHVLWSIIMFGVVYALLFALWIFVLNNKIQQGPDSPATESSDKKGLIGAALQIEREGHDLLGDERSTF